MSTPSSAFLKQLRKMIHPSDPRIGALGDVVLSTSLIARGRDIVPLGSTERRVLAIGEGIAMRYRLLPDGGRQIFMFLLPGDACNPNLFNATPMDHAIAAVTPVRLEQIPHDSMLVLLKKVPEVNQALWSMADQQTAVMRDRIMGLGRCDARIRVALLLWELVMRLRVSEAQVMPVVIPITQALLADAVGVTHIHFNRIVSEFCRLGILATQRGRLFVTNPRSLQVIASEITCAA
ncbi:Crp/Fnr family transcriptional regulator [Tianweitania sediminis]|jgi:CRP-like cAMP-binding protein|uniref:Crp/Fnr family transcriptional regulator n=1 Tax=Tianweitania sediminis TaxID=1502156 RepID=A0A8J7UMQ4_9HYPH|nr:Crp/Fnr family transcriptional regulator [Tianweitania sediminis]MBP0440617.1 Crp/Fnr family transcriptional regulator [Tianweitania sediminis]HEV7416108.1 Crp/Fnr family transcriptional regulator [Tianweitania sediminis]